MSPLDEIRKRLTLDTEAITEVVNEALSHSNSNIGQNVFLWQQRERTQREARKVVDVGAIPRLPLLGVPVSIKDCIEVEGYVSSCGSHFYAENNAAACRDAWIVQQVRAAGGVITGKTHMHQLAYGITGENADFGDCCQPLDASLLTGGSSSGAVASVQEGSAILAIGTDTGGSIRVPSALCGVVGFRSSVGVGSWTGGVHLARSFDTLGLLCRDLRDLPLFASAVLGIESVECSGEPKAPRIAIVPTEFLYDCDADVVAAYAMQQQELEQLGATLTTVNVEYWARAMDVFGPIQAHEAAGVQREQLAGRAGFEVFEPAIADRLTWGESISAKEIELLRRWHREFQVSMDTMLQQYDFLLLPCAPMSQLLAGADHSKTRQKILRYTTPVSLAGLPAVSLPRPGGIGMQLVCGRGRDAELLAYASVLHGKISG